MNENQELFDAIAAEEHKPADLVALRKKASELRDEHLRLDVLQAEVKKVQANITRLERKDLVDMFNEAKVSSVTVDPEGNQPAFVAERNTVYNAKIPDDKRVEAFDWFEQQGHGDLIKSIINIIFGMQEHEERLRVMKILADNGIQYYTNESIHHQTLKAFVKREIQAGHIIPRELLGVYVFDEVKIKAGE
jgi:hypothetical protein